MDFTEDFIFEINKEFSYINLIPTPCGIISPSDGYILAANELLWELLKLGELPQSLENFTAFDFSSLLKDFAHKDENIIKTNTEIIKFSDFEGEAISANIDIRIVKYSGRELAITVFKVQPAEKEAKTVEFGGNMPEAFEIIDAIFDKLPLLVCIPDKINNDFMYTNKYAEDFFDKDETNEEKILAFAEYGRTGILDEEAEINGKKFLVYAMKLKLKNGKILELLIALENKLPQRVDIRKRAGIDCVSGAYNKIYAVKGIESLCFKTDVDGSIFSLCYIDVNNLGRINKEYGNESGDRVLKKLVDIIRSNTRRSDYIARMENDEFVVILPDCGAVTADRIMKNIADVAYNELGISCGAEGDLITYGISEIGGGTNKSPEELIEHARKKMIGNKEK